MAGKLYGIGVGPGDPELITLKALRLMKECDVIGIPGKNPSESVAYKIAEGAYPEIGGKELLQIVTPMTKNMDILNAAYQKGAKQIEACLDEGKNVGLLTLGDPTIYSTYIYIQRFVQADGYDAEIINGIPSFCAVSAKFNDSLVDRQEQLHVIPASYQIEDALKLPGTKVLMKAASKLNVVKQTLSANNQRAVMIENCGMPDERIYHSVEEFPETGSYYSLTIVKE